MIPGAILQPMSIEAIRGCMLIAKGRDSWHKQASRPGFSDDPKLSRIDKHRIGVVGEWALGWEYLKVHPPRVIKSPLGDGGIFDVPWLGKTLEIKTTHHQNGNLIQQAQKGGFRADLIALCTTTLGKWNPTYLVGWVTREEWWELMTETDFGHGPTHFFPREHLRPIPSLLGQERNPPPPPRLQAIDCGCLCGCRRRTIWRPGLDRRCGLCAGAGVSIRRPEDETACYRRPAGA